MSEDKMAKDTTKAPKKEKVESAPRKIAGFEKTARITIVAEKNPKRVGSASYQRFAKYKNGQTIQAYLDAGGSASDIKWDHEKGYIKIAA